MDLATTDGSPSIPSDVLALAGRTALTARIQPVSMMSQELNRGRSMAPRVEQDVEIESEQHIVTKVDVTARSFDDVFSA